MLGGTTVGLMLPLHWFVISPCGLCGEPLQGAATRHSGALCGACQERLALPAGGLHGNNPIPWWSTGVYGGSLRELLLQLRRRPRPELVRILAGGMAETLRQGGTPGEQPLLVPIPSWKRQANPLPGLLCAALERHGGLRQAELLERSRPVLGQHHLGRDLRLANQAGAFRCRRPPGVGERARRPLLIVDDILTTGATVCSAAEALRQNGWRVLGAVCLARTPQGARQAVL
jgi:predicted amidophosphoribosyltransferase